MPITGSSTVAVPSELREEVGPDAYFPVRSSGRGAAIDRSVAGFHRRTSMPLMIPYRSSRRSYRTPSSPHPYSGVWISGHRWGSP